MCEPEPDTLAGLRRHGQELWGRELVRRLSILLAGLAGLAGCTFATTFNASYFPQRPVPEDQRIDGRVLVLTDPQDDAYVYSGSPTSFTGSATTLTLPLGQITREAAAAAFTNVFRGGAEKSNDRSGLDRYRTIVTPRVKSFTYEYNALRNLGFAATPQVAVQVTVTLVDAQGKPALQRTYDSGTIDGDTYVISGAPGERVAKAAHEALFDLMMKAAVDVRALLLARPTA
jgi:hypothetical protein